MTGTIITSPNIERVSGKVEFFIGGGEVRFVICHLDDNVSLHVVDAIAKCIRVAGSEDNE